MSEHIHSFNNENKAIIGENNQTVPLCYFNLIRLKQGERYRCTLDNYESVYVLASGVCHFEIEGEQFESVGGRSSIWEGPADSVYVPQGKMVEILCASESAEILVGGGLCSSSDPVGKATRIKPEDVKMITYGSDETKTHRQIQHIIGQNSAARMGRLLVSELFTVGAGGWSGFPPHKHDEDRQPRESLYQEVYHFRFNPEQGFGAQFVYEKDDDFGPVYHVKNGSTLAIDKGYHPVVAAPGYQMYYFTIIVGATDSSLVQYFHPDHKDQLETIPGIKDMIAAFK